MEFKDILQQIQDNIEFKKKILENCDDYLVIVRSAVQSLVKNIKDNYSQLAAECQVSEGTVHFLLRPLVFSFARYPQVAIPEFREKSFGKREVTAVREKTYQDLKEQYTGRIVISKTSYWALKDKVETDVGMILGNLFVTYDGEIYFAMHGKEPKKFTREQFQDAFPSILSNLLQESFSLGYSSWQESTDVEISVSYLLDPSKRDRKSK